jgi:hypothetical protein
MATNTLKKALPAFFAEAGLLNGAEKTFHALFCHHLYAQGLGHEVVGREVILQGRSPVDVVIFDAPARGDFSRTELARIAVEFKGGAYGNRNALNDEVRPGEPIADLDKLAALPGDRLDKWFICIDLPELGRALDAAGIAAVAETASARGINFAYYCAGEDSFSLRTAGRRLTHEPIVAPKADGGSTVGIMKALAPTGSVLNSLRTAMSGLRGSEDVLVTQIYHALRKYGLSARQLSLETYYSFATGASRMQYRPDLSVFAPGAAGRFNLYRNGNRRTSNDALKLAHLNALIEVKGSTATARASDKATVCLFQKDLDKLVMWRERASDAAKALGVAADFASIFIGADLRPRRLDAHHLAGLEASARSGGVQFIYLAI